MKTQTAPLMLVSAVGIIPSILYATHKLNDTISIGFGINNPFGLSTNWSPTSETNQVATLSDIKTTDFNPNIAVKVNDKFSVAAGVDFVQSGCNAEEYDSSRPYLLPFILPVERSRKRMGWEYCRAVQNIRLRKHRPFLQKPCSY